MGRNTKQFLVGSVWDGKYGNLIVKDYINKNKVLVRFINTGYEKFTDSSAIRKGTVKDPYFPTVAGVGCIGNTTSSVNGKVKGSYHVWRGMMSRCYEYKKSSRTYYGEVEVCKEWWCFEVYEKWYNENYIEGYQVDKDLTIAGSKIYSPETCCFIPNRINCIMGKKKYNTIRRHENLPVGVSYHIRDGKFTAQCFDGDKLQHFGYHDTPDSAFSAYKEFKEELIKSIALEYYESGSISNAVYKSLMNYKVTPFYE